MPAPMDLPQQIPTPNCWSIYGKDDEILVKL